MPATTKTAKSAKSAKTAKATESGESAESASTGPSKTEKVETLVVEALETAAAGAKDAVEIAVKTGNRAAAKSYEQVVAAATEQAGAAREASLDAFKSCKGVEDVIACHKHNFDAMIEASGAWVSGIQSLNEAWGAFAGQSVEQGAASVKRLIHCKSVEEFLAVNSETAQSSCAAAVSEAKNINDMSVKLVEAVARPLTARIYETVSQFGRSLAA